MHEETLRVEKLNKTYKNSSFGLKNIDLTIEKGTVMGLVGENGAGKTTLLKCILGLKQTDSGNVYIFGEDVGKDRGRVDDRIGVVFDELSFPEELTLQNMDTVLGNLHSGWDSQSFLNMCKSLELNPGQKIKEYSKGMKMKLGIASALAHKPEFLLLDEPTSGLDPVMRNHILEVLDDYIEEVGGTILFSTHITTDLEKIADHITFIHKGKILLSEEKEKLLSEYVLLTANSGEEKWLDSVAEEDLVSVDSEANPSRAVVKNGKRYADSEAYAAKPVNIEEIMLEMIKGEVPR